MGLCSLQLFSCALPSFPFSSLVQPADTPGPQLHLAEANFCVCSHHWEFPYKVLWTSFIKIGLPWGLQCFCFHHLDYPPPISFLHLSDSYLSLMNQLELVFYSTVWVRGQSYGLSRPLTHVQLPASSHIVSVSLTGLWAPRCLFRDSFAFSQHLINIWQTEDIHFGTWCL